MADNKPNTPEPSTSKNEVQKNSSHDLSVKKGSNDRRSNSDSYSSGTYSVKSRLDMAGGRPDGAKAPVARRELKPQYRKKNRRRGRIQKRRRSQVRRHTVRKAPKRRSKRDISASSIFTRLSRDSVRRSSPRGCRYCGHRCCLRRYQNEKQRVRFKKDKIKKPSQKTRNILRSECIQTGSRSVMFSPLFIKSNLAPASVDAADGTKNYAEISPEIIHDTVKKLMMWRQNVDTMTILDYMTNHYPVNPNQLELLEELKEKLIVAAIVGIITQISNDVWSLSTAFQNRKLAENHVTLFWKIYADSMKPVTRKNMIFVDEDRDERQTNTAWMAKEKRPSRNNII